ncbi:MAG: class II aldolase/adducin family protein [Candidatus Omnitrophica bacterium]|jgi:rhamnose utilization protein RhaD (predicted bifunctional aldolase and dehydrogenase)|nr:class II aldolase/adducin family protein [Candidatus Omnitrophota bacterium]
MIRIEQFVRLSKYAGERFDLVQAAGGNSSVKFDNGLMLVKESGNSLTEVELDKGYVELETKKIIEILEDKRLLSLKKKEKDILVRGLLKDSPQKQQRTPSIEIFLHALLYRYTLHVHPLVINAIVCRKDYSKILRGLFSEKIAVVNYVTPGIELALKLQKVIQKYQNAHHEKPKVVFLQNHGLIVSSDDPKECVKLLEGFLEKAEKHLGVNFNEYKLTNKVSELVNSLKNTHYISYVSWDNKLISFLKSKKTLFFKKPFCPDGVVYCGVVPLKITNLKDKKPFIVYRQKFKQVPRIVIFNDQIFFVGQNVKQAREIEDVLKSNLLTLDSTKGKVNFLKRKEIDYLTTWEAERYRKNKV